jgi:hypothetical protein
MEMLKFDLAIQAAYHAAGRRLRPARRGMAAVPPLLQFG